MIFNYQRFITLILLIANTLLSQSYGKNVTLDFRILFEEKAVSPHDQTYSSQYSDSIHFERIKFYISKVKIEFEDGSNYTDPTLSHLIDFEDASSLKVELKNVAKKFIKSLHFLIGTDSLTNVSGAMNGDLDPLKGMYWAWNSGYINFKLEGQIGKSTSKRDNFSFHIGGYLPPYPTVQTKEFDVSKSNKNSNFCIGLDLSQLLKNTDLSKSNSILIPGKKSYNFAKNILAEAFKLIEL